jgi:beta-glucosidase
MGPRYVEYKEGIYVGYRHFDKARRDVLFPFGFGLSYTNFRFRNLIIEGTFLEEGKIKLSVDVTNIGTVPGAEVVQVYVTEMRPSVDREQSALKAFKKVSLNPEETKTVIFELDETAFRYFDDTKNDWNITAGDFKVLVGNSSRDIQLSDVVYIEPKSMPLKHAPNFAASSEDIRVLNNDRYTRATIDDAATTLDIKRVSLNGWLLYQGIKLGATSMVPKGIDRVTRRMVRRSAVTMPLRQLAIFSNGKMSHDGVAGIILIVKGKLFKGLKLLLADLRKNKLHPNKIDLYPLDE